jgi:NIMA-interacting peptidyl-prolyl cis-trans isomerase 1
MSSTSTSSSSSSPPPDLPAGWQAKVSKSRGCYFYINQNTGETQWEVPTAPAPKGEANQVQCLHILKKHAGSRRPSSWRQKEITQTKNDSIQQINVIIEVLKEANQRGGARGLEEKFREIARVESDCGSAEKGGDLGMFTRGQMQKPFEDASFSLGVGGLSSIVDTDSGIHVILRLQ